MHKYVYIWVSILRYLALAKEFINELTLFIRVSKMRCIQIPTYTLLTFKMLVRRKLFLSSVVCIYLVIQLYAIFLNLYQLYFQKTILLFWSVHLEWLQEKNRMWSEMKQYYCKNNQKCICSTVESGGIFFIPAQFRIYILKRLLEVNKYIEKQAMKFLNQIFCMTSLQLIGKWCS